MLNIFSCCCDGLNYCCFYISNLYCGARSTQTASPIHKYQLSIEESIRDSVLTVHETSKQPSGIARSMLLTDIRHHTASLCACHPSLSTANYLPYVWYNPIVVNTYTIKVVCRPPMNDDRNQLNLTIQWNDTDFEFVFKILDFYHVFPLSFIQMDQLTLSISSWLIFRVFFFYYSHCSYYYLLLLLLWP